MSPFSPVKRAIYNGEEEACGSFAALDKEQQQLGETKYGDKMASI